MVLTRQQQFLRKVRSSITEINNSLENSTTEIKEFPNPYLMNAEIEGNLKNWHDALVKMGGGSYRPRILCVGDSTTAGYTTGNEATAGNDATSKSYPFKLAEILSKRGYDARGDAFFGMGSGTSNFRADTHPYITLYDGDWTNSFIPNSFPTVGGYFLFCNGGNGTLKIEPTKETDSIRIYWQKLSNGGTMNVSVNGSILHTIDTTTGNAINILDVSLGSVASNHVIEVTGTGSGQISIGGVEFYNSTKKEIILINGGWNGSKTSSDQWSSSAPTGLAHIASIYPAPCIKEYIKPDLCLLMLGINDNIQSSTDATIYKTNMIDIITRAKHASGDIALMSFVKHEGVVSPLQEQYVTALGEISKEQDLPFFNLWALKPNAPTQIADGFMEVDNIHPTELGYYQNAEFISKWITLGV